MPRACLPVVAGHDQVFPEVGGSTKDNRKAGYVALLKNRLPQSSHRNGTIPRTCSIFSMKPCRRDLLNALLPQLGHVRLVF